MTVMLVISGVLLFASALLIGYRVLAGPNSLDRLVGVDALLAIAMCGLAAWMVYTRDTTIAPAVVALALVGFIGSVSVARFRVRDEE
ncbi:MULTISPECIES: monovalent cation/H+ antiporter complex subunit F [unclassified Rhodococcus (in: high G+C Gram-positive bacteria)]|uniref:monovalent cation/H+ antiporter complex subunit F n=1 Tax=unclassified Rhodococcus (in: high G+C Gram-positive bacteria) TaxID=192944 RepID=UPI00146A8FBF|nr:MULTISPECIES: monovalent cation/H+ antiporter complex subunit F [unclassified Rhodococcus (in: high G+C Gram-positive bacteria)]MCK0090271.1 monovalent cation/H+ antiporter complex subunit F [Rhodococcus sp. F64268]NLU61479.1 cation:proton antiporter [Rhodococcus sp. HNM0563]HET8993318.1 monovalent cation/H+ antiporter complex subunit F [Rhodococcus sp. (in: high G+C Gram-positive bacteria)]